MTSADDNPGDFQFGSCRVLSRRRTLYVGGVAAETGSRAFDILMVLIAARGELVTKDELLQKVWPNVIVEENTLQSQIHALRKALGSERGAVQTVPGRGYRFVGDLRSITGREEVGAPPVQLVEPTHSSTLTNIPAEVSPIIGRDQDLAELLKMMESVRLITLTGTGGIGKTKLAVEAGASVQILVTSREPLSGEGEHVFNVPPLDIPAPETRDLASVLKYGAAELLVARARAAAPTLSFDQRAVDAIGAICRRLDGIPLALELAAARIPALGLQIVSERLDQGFDLLSRGRRTGLARHHTLRATFDWSYQLLPEEHRAIFRRLSVFTGSFSLGAVRAILANSSLSENQLVDGLADLVAKSLLVADISGAEPRFRMLDTTRAYSAARLGETGEQETLRKRHAEYYRDLVVAAPDPTAAGWSAQLAPELDNLRAALAWAFGPLGDPSLGVKLSAASSGLWLDAGLLSECETWMQRALQHLDAAGSRGARAEMALQTALGLTLTFTQMSGQDAARALARALELGEKHEDSATKLRALNCLAMLDVRCADFPSAIAVTRKLETAASEANSSTGRQTAKRLLGISYHFVGDQLQAFANLSQCLPQSQTTAMRRSYAAQFGLDHRASTLAFLSSVLWLRGFPEQAARTAKESIEQARVLDHRVSLCHALIFGGALVSLRVGELAAAEQYADELMAHADELSSEIYRAYALAVKGLAGTRRGATERGLETIREALSAVRQHRVNVAYVMFTADFAEALAASGSAEEGLAVLEEGARVIEQSKGAYGNSEVLRVRGELELTTEVTGANASAREAFSQSLELARRQDALAWELRAAISLARLKQRHDARAAARDILAPTYSRFTEGFETYDLRVARALLEELS